MKQTGFILKGGIAWSEDKDHIAVLEDGYLVCMEGKVEAVLPGDQPLPERYRNLPVVDHTGRMILPGMTDLHVHGPQYTYRGIGMDLELLEWLNTHTFPEEARYADPEYARAAYTYFAVDLQRCFTTRAVIFATIHNESTKILMDTLEDTGIISYVGRVNMDRNGGACLQEASAEESLAGTRAWLAQIEGKYENTFPILTPRFIPSCSDELMRGLGDLAKEKDLRIQSHLSENLSEIAWVRELVPEASGYGDAYDRFGHMGTPLRPTVMAHCVHVTEEELQLLQERGTYVAHCPDSNLNLTSGIAPVRKMLDRGIRIGLGTDVAAGSSMNMVKTMLCALQSSKMYYRLVDSDAPALSFEEVFYLATAGGGSYFGDVGTFHPGYAFDAVVIDDSIMQSMRHLSLRERIERMTYNDTDCIIRDKYVAGRRIWENPVGGMKRGGEIWTQPDAARS